MINYPDFVGTAVTISKQSRFLRWILTAAGLFAFFVVFAVAAVLIVLQPDSRLYTDIGDYMHEFSESTRIARQALEENW